MSRWLEDADEVSDSGIFDPLCVQRSAPLDDEEAAMVEALCQEATPGPLVIDDEAQGEGAVVVGLPDGRMIVSLTAPVEQTLDESATRANAELICKARYLLLRLLRDRQQWQQQRESLLKKIRTLEAGLRQEETTAAQPEPSRTRPR